MRLLNVAAMSAAILLATTAFSTAADLIVDTPTVAAEAPATDWTGAYVGASVGAGWGVVTSAWDPIYSLPPYEDDLDGWLGGVQAGYNFQTGPLVLGVEASIDWTSLATAGEPDALPRDINWIGSLRGRLGFAVESVLLYATAGYTVADTFGGSFLEQSDSLHNGWTVGAGVEAMLTDSLSVKLEYAYSSFETKRYEYTDPGEFTLDTGFDTSVVKVGANFHF